MPFSRSSTWTASTISLDIPSSLQQVAALDVGVRDRDNPVVGGDGHLAVGRADQLAGEALAPAVLSLGAHARAPPDEATEVVRLRQRTLRPRRGDLQTGMGQEVAQVARDALAGVEVDPARAVDHEPRCARARLLHEQDLDLRLDLREALFYLLLGDGGHCSRRSLGEK